MDVWLGPKLSKTVKTDEVITGIRDVDPYRRFMGEWVKELKGDRMT